MTPTILIAGTWANGSTALLDDAWWKPGSVFAEEGKRHGLVYPDETDFYEWCTGLDGIDSVNAHWRCAAKALIWYCKSKSIGPVNVIAHSHGGQVAAYASGLGLQIENLVTVATPVRDDIVFHRANIKRFVHLYGGQHDPVQLLGELSLETLANIKLDLEKLKALKQEFVKTQREMALADKNICEPECGHSDLHQATLWTEKKWWDFLAP